MLVVMEHGATPGQVAGVVRLIEELGYQARPMPGAQRTAVGLVGNDGRVDGSRFETLPGVAQVIHVTKPYKQVSREWRPENTVVTIAPGVHVGGDDITSSPARAPSSRRSRSSPPPGRFARQGLPRCEVARSSLAARRTRFRGWGNAGSSCSRSRGGRRASRSSPRPWTRKARSSWPMYADCIQIGARNMQNYSLLRTVGRLGKPVLLKRGHGGDDQRPVAERGVHPEPRATSRSFSASAAFAASTPQRETCST